MKSSSLGYLKVACIFWVSVMSGSVNAAIKTCDQIPVDNAVLNMCNQSLPVRVSQIKTENCIDPKDFETWKCLIIDKPGKVELCNQMDDSGETTPFNMTVLFTVSDAELDCNGAVISHQFKGKGKGPGHKRGVTTIPDRKLSDLTIKNCNFEDIVQTAIHIQRDFKGKSFLGEPKANFDFENGLITDKEDPYVDQGHSNIRISNTRVTNAKAAVYLDPYTRDTRIDRLISYRSREFGIYFDLGSHHNTIVNSTFAYNHTDQRLSYLAAVNIDSSHDNTLENNRFVGNLNDIKAYKNCGELIDSTKSNYQYKRCPITRVTPASGNNIVNNYFESSYGISLTIASRQGMNFPNNYCLDYTIESQNKDRPRMARDYAKNNRIINNTFICKDRLAISINDSDNIVEGNRVLGVEECQAAVRVSTGYFPPTNLPSSNMIKNVEIKNNSFGGNFIEPTLDIAPMRGISVKEENNCFKELKESCLPRGFRFDYKSTEPRIP